MDKPRSDDSSGEHPIASEASPILRLVLNVRSGNSTHRLLPGSITVALPRPTPSSSSPISLLIEPHSLDDTNTAPLAQRVVFPSRSRASPMSMKASSLYHPIVSALLERSKGQYVRHRRFHGRGYRTENFDWVNRRRCTATSICQNREMNGYRYRRFTCPPSRQLLTLLPSVDRAFFGSYRFSLVHPPCQAFKGTQ